MIVACGVIVRVASCWSPKSSDGSCYRPDWLATLSYDTWMLWAGVGCAFMALILLIRSASRTHIAVGAEQRVFGRPIDFARMSTSTARRIPGVVDASRGHGRRQVTVQSTATPGQMRCAARCRITRDPGGTTDPDPRSRDGDPSNLAGDS